MNTKSLNIKTKLNDGTILTAKRNNITGFEDRDQFGNTLKPGDKVVICLRWGQCLGTFLGSMYGHYLYIQETRYGDKISLKTTTSRYSPIKADWVHEFKEKSRPLVLKTIAEILEQSQKEDVITVEI